MHVKKGTDVRLIDDGTLDYWRGQGYEPYEIGDLLIAPAFAPSSPYAAGQLVWQAGALYRAKTDFTSAGSFSAGDWDAVGNGGSIQVPTNWCSWQLAPPGAALTGAASGPHYYSAAEIEITHQTGTDFTTADRVWFPGGSSNGGIVSAAGGIFEVAAYIGTPGATLDGGSTAQRFLWNGASTGQLTGPIGGIGGMGYDGIVPVLNMWAGASTHRANPAWSPADSGVLHDIFSKLLGGSGTDALNIDDGLISGYIWQVGPAPVV